MKPTSPRPMRPTFARGFGVRLLLAVVCALTLAACTEGRSSPRDSMKATVDVSATVLKSCADGDKVVEAGDHLIGLLHDGNATRADVQAFAMLVNSIPPKGGVAPSEQLKAAAQSLIEADADPNSTEAVALAVALGQFAASVTSAC